MKTWSSIIGRPTVALYSVFLAAACAGKDTVLIRNELLEPGYQIVVPREASPYPVALLFHGCGGLVGYEGEKHIMRDYAATAAEAGYLVIIVDSFRPRNIGFDKARHRVCTGLKLRGPTRAGDIVAAVDYAQRRDDTLKDGYVLAGWSHGGWAVMEVMTMDMANDWPPGLDRPQSDVMDPVAGVYLTYPYCGIGARTKKRRWPKPLPTSLVIAGEDTVAKAEACDKAFERMRESGVPMDMEVFEGMTHAFDEDDQTEGSAFVFDAEESKRAHERFKRFLISINKARIEG